jgi:hypothetical protein
MISKVPALIAAALILGSVTGAPAASGHNRHASVAYAAAHGHRSVGPEHQFYLSGNRSANGNTQVHFDDQFILDP